MGYAETLPRMGQQESAATKETSWRFTSLTLFLCALVLAPMLAYRMTVDQGVFAYIGAEVLKGRWPYLHTWESDPPGLMFLQAAEILVLGKSMEMFRLFDCLVQLCNVYLIYRLACRIGSHRAAALFSAVLYCLVYQGYGPWNTAQREGFGLLFVLLGFWLWHTSNRERPYITAATIGVTLGIAVLIKPTLLALSLFYMPLLPEVRRREARLTILAAAAGLLVPVMAVVAFYWMQNGLYELYQSCVLFQFIYTARLRGTDPVWVYWLSKIGKLGGNAVGIAVIYAPFLAFGKFQRERLMLYLAYLGSVYAVFVQGTFAGYHYLPGLGVGSILIGGMFSQTSDVFLGNRSLKAGSFRFTLKGAAACAMVLAAMFFYIKPATVSNFLSLRFLRRPVANEYRNNNVFDFTESYDLAEFLRTNTGPEDRIQVWGNESLVYYMADRSAASRFQMTKSLVMRIPDQPITPMQERWRREFINDIQSHRPPYVAVVSKDNWWWTPDEQTSEQLLDDFPEWKALIQQSYTLDRKIGRFLVYRIRSNQSSIYRPNDDPHLQTAAK